MYRVYHSNDLSSLVENYSNLFHSHSLFGEKVITIVQNRNISSWLKLKLTEVDGISMDLNVEYPENGVRLLVQGYESGKALFKYKPEREKSLLFMDSLKIVVYKTLEEALKAEDKYPELYKYVSSSTQKLFQLSDSIAGLFYHYGMNCPGMVAAWDKGELYSRSGENPQRISEQQWQMSLWRDIFSKDKPFLHISKVLNTVLESGESYDSSISPLGKCRIILFGSSFLGESAIKFFNYISRDLDVHHFILTPSIIYTKEVPEKPASILSRFSGLIDGFTSLSREDYFIKSRQVLHNKFKGITLLEKIQTGIWNNSLLDMPDNNKELEFVNDGSLSISKVTGGWREVEVLKDKILNLLDNSKELRLTDIGVVAPDINYYASYIEAVFPDFLTDENGDILFNKKHLPYNIMGLNGDDSSPYIKGINSIINLVGSDFNRKDVFELISNRCFLEAVGINNSVRDLYIDFVNNLNIKWGVDGHHKELLGYKNRDFNTWEEGFERFLLGIALNKEDHYKIPYTIEDSQGVKDLGKLIYIIRSLYCDLYELNTLRLNFDEWVLFIETIIEKYLRPLKSDFSDERDRLSVKNQFRNLLNLYDDLDNLNSFNNKTIPYQVFKSLFKEFVIKSGGSKGRYLTQGITFSSLKPLRAVPFKHIFVLGLNEDSFPGKERILSYDLRSIYDQRIDLSKRQNDKFAFLELILSANESLNLFYTGKNMVSGEELQPSVVINELLEAININFDNKLKHSSLVENHPLQNFDEQYFVKDSSIYSFNKNAYESAYTYRELKSPYNGLCLRDERVRDTVVEIDIKDLIMFIKNPVKTFFTKGELIYLNPIENSETDIFENMELDFLYKWKFANYIMNLDIIDNLDIVSEVSKFFSLAQKEGCYLNSDLTKGIKDNLLEVIISIDNQLNNYGLKNSNFKNNPREIGSEYSALSMDVNGKKVIITGELNNLWIDNDNAFIPSITLGSKKKMEAKDKIEPYVNSLILFNHPNMSEKLIKVYCFGKEDIEPVILKRNGDSKEKLEKLVSAYLKNLEEPIPLFPQVMKGISEEFKISEIERNWESAINDTIFHSDIRECIYTDMAYDSIPEFKEEDVKLFYESIYRELSDE